MDALFQAKATFPLGIGGTTLPDEIQWMPPGRHTVRAMKGDETVEREVVVTDQTAAMLSRQLSDYIQAGGDTPYIDFNHEDRDAAARVKAVRWAGDDPSQGGVRIAVEWSEPGKAALAGKAYRRFSPSFYLDADGGVTGAPLNMGGLVNRAAFKTIQPIWSRAGDESPQEGNDMSDHVRELADLRAALTAKDTELEAVQAKLTAASSDAAMKAKDAEIATLKQTIANLQKSIDDQKVINAKAVVDAAVKSGRIAPQATELHAKWVSAITHDPSLAEALNAMAPANPPTPGMLTTPGAAPGQGASKKPEEQFAELVKAKSADGKLSRAQALQAAIAQSPELYAAWRDSGGKVALA